MSNLIEILSSENLNLPISLTNSETGAKVNLTNMTIAAQIDLGTTQITGTVTKDGSDNSKFEVFFTRQQLRTLESRKYTIQIFINNSDAKRFARLESSFKYVQTNLTGIAGSA